MHRSLASRTFAFSFIFVFASLQLGCATIFKGSKSCVNVAGMGPQDSAALSGGSGQALRIQSDGAIEVPLRAGDHVVLGINGPAGPRVATTSKKLGGGWLILDLLAFFPIGLIVDAATGNWMEYDDTGVQPEAPGGAGVPTVVAPAQ